MNRRRFMTGLAGIVAAASAPAFVPFGSLMVPRRVRAGQAIEAATLHWTDEGIVQVPATWELGYDHPWVEEPLMLRLYNDGTLVNKMRYDDAPLWLKRHLKLAP